MSTTHAYRYSPVEALLFVRENQDGCLEWLTAELKADRFSEFVVEDDLDTDFLSVTFRYVDRTISHQIGKGMYLVKMTDKVTNEVRLHAYTSEKFEEVYYDYPGGELPPPVPGPEVVTDYSSLINLPRISGIELLGDKTIEDLGLASFLQGAKADSSYQLPMDGISTSDLDSTVTDSLLKADSAYQLPVDGIPVSDMDTTTQENLLKADSAYQLPVDGIPASELDSTVTDNLLKASSAYQLPVDGIPTSDLNVVVRDSLLKADSAYQLPVDGISTLDLNSTIADSLLKADSAYQLPVDGISTSELDVTVRNNLIKADSALQEETDPTVPSWAKSVDKPLYNVSEINGAITVDVTDALKVDVDTESQRAVAAEVQINTRIDDLLLSGTVVVKPILDILPDYDIGIEYYTGKADHEGKHIFRKTYMVNSAFLPTSTIPIDASFGDTKQLVGIDHNYSFVTSATDDTVWPIVHADYASDTTDLKIISVFQNNNGELLLNTKHQEGNIDVTGVVTTIYVYKREEDAPAVTAFPTYQSLLDDINALKVKFEVVDWTGQTINLDDINVYNNYQDGFRAKVSTNVGAANITPIPEKWSFVFELKTIRDAAASTIQIQYIHLGNTSDLVTVRKYARVFRNYPAGSVNLEWSNWAVVEAY